MTTTKLIVGVAVGILLSFAAACSSGSSSPATDTTQPTSTTSSSPRAWASYPDDCPVVPGPSDIVASTLPPECRRAGLAVAIERADLVPPSGDLDGFVDLMGEWCVIMDVAASPADGLAAATLSMTNADPYEGDPQADALAEATVMGAAVLCPEHFATLLALSD